MFIRRWQQKDNPTIALLETLCFSVPWSEHMIGETFCAENFKGLVAVNKLTDKVIGYIGVVFSQEDADIALIAVHPDFRRQHIGFKLIGEMIAELKKTNVQNLFLEVRVSNVGARALYEKAGFKAVGIRKKYYENTEDAIVMYKGI